VTTESNPEDGELSVEAELAGLHARVSDLENQLADATLDVSHSKVRAAEAEAALEPAKDRIRREARRDIERAKHDVLRGLLEVLDNFDRALESHVDGRPLAEGLVLVRKHFMATLEGHGVTVMDSLNQPFQPAIHEAISAIPVAEPDSDGRIVAVVKCGYLINGELLRPARVAVGKLT